MRTILIKEGQPVPQKYDFVLDLMDQPPRPCTGCWSCWTRTPGRCAQKDLDAFYRQYVAADRAVILSKVRQGFVSHRLKNLLDRMIALFLPYITYRTGESMHLPRYDRLPEATIYYDGDFASPEEKEVYINYLNRAMYQFYTKCEILPLERFAEKEAALCAKP
jgi:multimeric flavodoxin WrbA